MFLYLRDGLPIVEFGLDSLDLVGYVVVFHYKSWLGFD